MQQEPEALGEVRTGVKPWLLLPSEPSGFFFFLPRGQPYAVTCPFCEVVQGTFIMFPFKI